jgi:purine-binding chemotaxis protein CheW
VSVYVRLRIAAEVYAMPVAHVVSVARFGEVAPVPGSSPAILGVRNLRGQVLPVADLAYLLGVATSVPPAALIVVEAAGVQAGFAVDEVTGVGELADPTEDTKSALLAGATLTDGDLIGVINIGKVFDALEGAGSERV